MAFLIETYTSYDYEYCLIFSGGFVLLYTSLGGFVAINKIDVIQGSLMLFALLLVPITILLSKVCCSGAKDLRISAIDMLLR